MDHQLGYNRKARKLLHIAGGLPALLIPFLPYWLMLAGAVAGTALAYALKPTHGWLRTITKPIDRQRGVISGVRGYFAAVVALLLLWQLLRWLHVAGSGRYIIFGWLALALGDGLAGILGPGPAYGHTVPWNRNKTWLGVIGCFVGTLIAFIAAFMTPLSQIQPATPAASMWLLAGLSSLMVALAESVDIGLDDNYVVGLGAPLVALLLVGLTGM